MFLHMSVILSMGVSATHPLGRHLPHPWADTPTPLGRHTPHPCADTPGQTPPGVVHAGIWSTSGRYASYWNAFLFKIITI